MGEIALGGLEPLVELVGLEHVGHQRLAGLRIFGVAHRQQRIHQMEFGRSAHRADRPHRVVHVVGDGLEARIAAGRDIDRDAVVGPENFAAQERLVVRGVVPGGDAGDHVLIELLGIFERLCGLRRVEDDLVVLVDQIAAMRP